jgi:hypothetical protein
MPSNRPAPPTPSSPLVTLNARRAQQCARQAADSQFSTNATTSSVFQGGLDGSQSRRREQEANVAELSATRLPNARSPAFTALRVPDWPSKSRVASIACNRGGVSRKKRLLQNYRLCGQKTLVHTISTRTHRRDLAAAQGIELPLDTSELTGFSRPVVFIVCAAKCIDFW